MKCLYCGKPILDTASNDELTNLWHNRCVKKFFNTNKLPSIDISNDSLQNLATECVNKGYTVTGVQKKLSVHLSYDGCPRLTLVNYPSSYILKPQVDEFESLPESENLVMSMADITGIKTVPHALMTVNGNTAYITKRIDRFSDNGEPATFAMEDFCQLDERLTQDKYKGSYERCAKIIEKYSSNVGLDISEFFLRLVFSFAVGNSDMHLKNFSLVEKEEGSNIYSLSKAYDLLPVNVIMPEDTEELAMTLNGKKKNIKRKDFIEFAKIIDLNEIVAERLINKVIMSEDEYHRMCNESPLSEKFKDSLNKLIKERINKLI